MKQKRKLNVRLLRRIQHHILEEPRRLNMGKWDKPEDERPSDQMPPCKTVGCIAGWATHLSNRRPRTEFGFARIGAELLGVSGVRHQAVEFDGYYTDPNGEAPRLFIVDSWPAQFQKRYDRYIGDWTPRGFMGRARATVSRIEHFIQTGE